MVQFISCTAHDQTLTATADSRVLARIRPRLDVIGMWRLTPLEFEGAQVFLTRLISVQQCGDRSCERRSRATFMPHVGADIRFFRTCCWLAPTREQLCADPSTYTPVAVMSTCVSILFGRVLAGLISDQARYAASLGTGRDCEDLHSGPREPRRKARS